MSLPQNERRTVPGGGIAMVYFAVVFATMVSLAINAEGPRDVALAWYLLFVVFAAAISGAFLGAVLAVPFAILAWRVDRVPQRTSQERELRMSAVVLFSTFTVAATIPLLLGLIDESGAVWSIGRSLVGGLATGLAVIARRQYRLRNFSAVGHHPNAG